MIDIDLSFSPSPLLSHTGKIMTLSVVLPHRELQDDVGETHH